MSVGLFHDRLADRVPRRSPPVSPNALERPTPSADGSDAKRPRVLFCNRAYWPDVEATGQLLAELCEDLAGRFDVSVIAGQPNQNPDGSRFRPVGREVHRGVDVRRVWHSRFAKSFMPGRAVNLLSYLGSATLASLSAAPPDVVVVETDPPLLCLLGSFLKHWHGSKLVVYLQDIYPDIAVAMGKLPDGPVTRRLRRLMFSTYRRADRVVVLSRDMEQTLASGGVTRDRIARIPNWVDTRAITPMRIRNAFRHRHELDGQFVVMYSGNLGLCQRLEDVLEAADRLRDRHDVLFLLVGDGASRARLQESAAQRRLTNLRFLPYQPKDELAHSLSAANVHLVPIDPRVSRCLMPSKLYGVLASGSPVLAIAPENCELAEVTRSGNAGLVVPPGRPDLLADAVRRMADGRGMLHQMGQSARRLAVEQYDRRNSTDRFARMLDELCYRSGSNGR